MTINDKQQTMKSICIIAFAFFLLDGFELVAQTVTPNLHDMGIWKLNNRAAEPFDDDGKKGIRLSEAPNDGVMILKDFEFAEGTIELDIKGKNVLIHTLDPIKPKAGRFANRTNWGIMVTTLGSIMVAKTRENKGSLPRQRKRAKAYATKEEESTCPITEKTVMITVFSVHWGHMPKLNAST